MFFCLIQNILSPYVREMLQSLGKEFVIIKTLPSGIYHYRFMVDGWLTCAPDLPWVCDDSGNSYNVLDLMVILDFDFYILG